MQYDTGSTGGDSPINTSRISRLKKNIINLKVTEKIEDSAPSSSVPSEHNSKPTTGVSQ
jgi:hypothetical protein